MFDTWYIVITVTKEMVINIKKMDGYYNGKKRMCSDTERSC